MSKFSQKGISLYLSIIIMVILLAIVLGISGILLGQLKTIKGMENSVVAFYAADTGIEEVLKDIYGDSLNPPYSSTDIGNDASYNVEIVCCDPNSPGPDGCAWNGTPCPVGTIDSNCPGSYYCVKSVGTFRETKRAIQITL